MSSSSGSSLDVRVLVHMAGRDCAAYVERAVRSVAAQSHPSVHLLLVDDGSTDGTGEVAARLLEELLPGRHTLVREDEPRGKAAGISRHLRAHLHLADAVAVVDADDALVDDDVLAEVAARYAQGFDVVWTNYRTDGGGTGRNGPLDPFRSPRGQGWVTSHLFTFRAELLAAVPEHYFQDEDGRWLGSAADFALAYPVLDQTRRYCFLPRVAYAYTASNPRSHHNQDPQSTGLSSRAQQDSARAVLAKPPLPCTRLATEVPAVLHSALATRFAQQDERTARLEAVAARALRAAEEAPLRQVAVDALVRDQGVPLAWLNQVGGWALDAGFLHHLAGVLDGYRSPRVLEFGSGFGTRVLAKLVGDRGGRLTTVEHDPGWQQRTTDLLTRAGLDRAATVVHAPLVDMEFYEVPGRFYDLGVLPEDAVFDVVVVDGPPTETIRLARLPALPAVVPHLAPDFHVFLDDYERAEERKIVEVWQAVAPDLVYEELAFGKGVCAVTPPR